MNYESDFSIRIKGLKDVPEEVKDLLFELAGRLPNLKQNLFGQEQQLLNQEPHISVQKYILVL